MCLLFKFEARLSLTRLRFTLDTLPGSKKYIFTPDTRQEILSELYETFWGNHGSFFLPSAISLPPVQMLLSEVQQRHGFPVLIKILQ